MLKGCCRSLMNLEWGSCIMGSTPDILWQGREIAMFIGMLGVLLVFVSTSTAAISDDAGKARAMLDRVVIEVKKDQRLAIQMFTTGENGKT
jgi:hypothetical protein